MNVTAAVAEKVLEFDLMKVNNLAIVKDNIIVIDCHKIGSAFTTHHEELLLDMFETCYCGQQIEVIADDGENIEHRGIINFFEGLCQQGTVARSAVIFYSHHQKWDYNFQHKQLNLHIFKNTKTHFQDNFNFNNIDVDAKFIGCLISRFTPSRFNLAYQLDCVFPNNNFLIFRPSLSEVCNFYSLINGAYQSELNWMKSKKFDIDEILQLYGNHTGFLDWEQSTSTYHMLWPKFQIECVAETDVFSNSWFTEKTARCLASGKPFVLFSGSGSLKTLQKFGFKTFGDVIDESYDNKLTPRSRMTAMLQSLKDLYNDPDREFKINQLNKIAKFNQVAYDLICSEIG